MHVNLQVKAHESKQCKILNIQYLTINILGVRKTHLTHLLDFKDMHCVLVS